MELSPILLSELLFFSFLLGMSLGVFNDALRIIRVFFGVRYSKRRFDRLYSMMKYQKEKELTKKRGVRTILDCVIFFQDVVLAVVAASGIVILCYYLNDGEFRVFCVASMIIGAVLWYMSFGKIVMMFSEPIVVVLRFLVVALIMLLYAPIKLIFTLIVNMYKKISREMKKAIANKTNIRYNNVRKEYYTELSHVGFLRKDASKG